MSQDIDRKSEVGAAHLYTVQGSGRNAYTVTEHAGYWTCSCRDWAVNVVIRMRDGPYRCKHIRGVSEGVYRGSVKVQRERKGDKNGGK